MPINVDINIKDKEVYVSLIGPFMNMYAQVPYARNNIEARWICNQDPKLKHIWCSTYSLKKVQEMIKSYGGTIIHLNASGLEFHLHELEQLREQLKGKDEVSNAI